MKNINIMQRKEEKMTQQSVTDCVGLLWILITQSSVLRLDSKKPSPIGPFLSSVIKDNFIYFCLLLQFYSFFAYDRAKVLVAVPDYLAQGLKTPAFLYLQGCIVFVITIKM